MTLGSGGPLQRKAPMNRGTSTLKRSWIKRGDSRLERKTPMPRRKSQRVLDYEAELDAITPALKARSRGRCEVQIPGVCTKRAAVRHHRWRRSQRGPNILSNLLHSCVDCHGWGHDSGAGLAIGFLLKRGEDPEQNPYVPPRRMA